MSWLPDWITGFDRANYEAGVEADRRNADITEDLRRRGLITEGEAQASRVNYAEIDPDEEIDQAFLDGLDEGASNIRNFAGDTINTVVGTPLKLIPWQVWLAAALYAAWYFGLLKGVLKKR